MKLRRDILTRKLTKAFAENGSKVEIPLDIQPSGSVSFNEGFGGLYSKPVKPQSEGEQAGLQIQRENINWLFNAITSDVIQNSDDLGALEDEVSGLITSLNTKTPKLLTENLTWTVGSGGDYEKLTNALEEACKYKKYFNLKITIKILSGFSINENIEMTNCDLSFVEIISEDSEVGVTSDYIAFSYCLAPIIRTLFNFNNKGYFKADCLYNTLNISGESGKNSGFKNTSRIIINNANLQALYCQFSISRQNDTGYAEGFSLTNSIANFNNSNINIASSHTSSGDVVMFAVYNSYILLVNSNLTFNNQTSYSAVSLFATGSKLLLNGVEISLNIKLTIQLSRSSNFSIRDNVKFKTDSQIDTFISFGDGSFLTYEVKPTFQGNIISKSSIAYGILTANGSFCQNLE